MEKPKSVNKQADKDQQALEVALSPYLVRQHGFASYVRLRESVKLHPDRQGGQLLLLSDLIDAIWDASENQRTR